MLLVGSSTTSGTLSIYGSRSNSDSSNSFYVSVASDTFSISPLPVPLFGIVSFNTLPFLQRIAQTSSTSTLTLLVQPSSTTVANHVIIRANNNFTYPST